MYVYVFKHINQLILFIDYLRIIIIFFWWNNLDPSLGKVVKDWRPCHGWDIHIGVHLVVIFLLYSFIFSISLDDILLLMHVYVKCVWKQWKASSLCHKFGGVVNIVLVIDGEVSEFLFSLYKANQLPPVTTICSIQKTRLIFNQKHERFPPLEYFLRSFPTEMTKYSSV